MLAFLAFLSATEQRHCIAWYCIALHCICVDFFARLEEQACYFCCSFFLFFFFCLFFFFLLSCFVLRSSRPRIPGWACILKAKPWVARLLLAAVSFSSCFLFYTRRHRYLFIYLFIHSFIHSFIISARHAEEHGSNVACPRSDPKSPLKVPCFAVALPCRPVGGMGGQAGDGTRESRRAGAVPWRPTSAFRSFLANGREELRDVITRCGGDKAMLS